MSVEVATLRKDWTVIDRAEPCEDSGAAFALRTLWEDAQSVETRPAFGVIYVDGKVALVYNSKAEINAACAAVAS
jgi:hypothetical protein